MWIVYDNAIEESAPMGGEEAQMDHFEMVEKLREKTGVSYEDAKAALDAANWDLLDAIVILETQGKVEQGAKDYTTRQESRKEEHERKHNEFRSMLGGIARQIGRLIEKGNHTMLEVHKGGEAVFTLPMTVMAILLIFAVYVTVPLLIAGLFFGFSYRINAKGASASVMNGVMSKAGELAGTIRSEIEKGAKKHEK